MDVGQGAQKLLRFDAREAADFGRARARRIRGINEVNVECGSVRIAEHVLRMNDGWLQEGSVLSSPAGAAKGLNAGSFGELRSVFAVSPQMEEHETRGCIASLKQPLASRRYVEGLVVRHFGQDGLDRVRRYFADPSQANLYGLGLVMTSPLMPYIRAAQDQERGQGA